MRWILRLWREWILQANRPIAPAPSRPHPELWKSSDLTAAWLGHSTVLINFLGVTILIDPVLFPRIGIRLPFFTLGPKRLTAPALTDRELPSIDIVLLSHAHFDHIDRRTLKLFGKSTRVITASGTLDLLRGTRFGEVRELAWGETVALLARGLPIEIRAFRGRHWGARMRFDNRRGYNGYIISRNGRRVLYGGDTAMTDVFAGLNDGRGFDLAIMNIGAYRPWIYSHATPEQAIAMADAAGACFIMPIHHQTFKLSAEPFYEPIDRFTRALAHTPERIALRQIGETFVLPD